MSTTQVVLELSLLSLLFFVFSAFVAWVVTRPKWVGDIVACVVGGFLSLLSIYVELEKLENFLPTHNLVKLFVVLLLVIVSSVLGFKRGRAFAKRVE